MQIHEELLHVAIEAALAHLVRAHLDEGVVTTLHLHGQPERAERPGESTHPRCTRRRCEPEFAEKGIRNPQYGIRRDVCAMKVLHVSTWCPSRRGRPAS